jgi:hypothetical protein
LHGFQILNETMHQGECLGALLSIRDDTSVLQRLQVERKPGLARAQLIREITGTLFALAESLNQSQASSAAKGPE